MAVDLTGLNWSNGGANYKVTSVSTTNTEISIPKWAKLVTIQPVGQAIYFSYDGTDGAAVSAHAFPHAVNAIIQYNPQQTAVGRKIYVASQTGTATVYCIFE